MDPINLAIVVGQLVAGDRAQPGDRARSALVRGPTIDRLDERLLRQFLGESRVTAAPRVEVRIDPEDRILVPTPERDGIAEDHSEFDCPTSRGRVDRRAGLRHRRA